MENQHIYIVCLYVETANGILKNFACQNVHSLGGFEPGFLVCYLLRKTIKPLVKEGLLL